MGRCSIRLATTAFVSVIYLTGCHALRPSIEVPHVGECVTRSQITSPFSEHLAQAVIEPSQILDDAPLLEIGEFDCVLLCLQQFKHPLGQHFVSVNGDQTPEIYTLLPPGLSRRQQLEFYEALGQVVANAKNAYWNLLYAQKMEASLVKKIELQAAMCDIERRLLEEHESTSWQLTNQEIEMIQYRLQLLKGQSPASTTPNVERASRNLRSLCGLSGCTVQILLNGTSIEIAIPRCWDCDIQSVLARNAELLIGKFDAWTAVRSALPCPDKPRAWVDFSSNSKNPNLGDFTNTAFPLATRGEEATANQLLEIKNAIAAAEESLVLLSEQQEHCRQLLEWSESASSSGTLPARDVLLAELRLEQSKQGRWEVELALQLLSTQYSLVRGTVLSDARVRIPNFWLFVESSCPKCRDHQ